MGIIFLDVNEIKGSYRVGSQCHNRGHDGDGEQK